MVDNWHLEAYTKAQHLMVDGLNGSCGYIHGLLEAEIEAVGKENVVLWGLSQGCATSLASLLVWDGEPFAAVVGMCGWLPFGNLMVMIAGGAEDNGSEEEYEDLLRCPEMRMRIRLGGSKSKEICPHRRSNS